MSIARQTDGARVNVVLATIAIALAAETACTTTDVIFVQSDAAPDDAGFIDSEAGTETPLSDAGRLTDARDPDGDLDGGASDGAHDSGHPSDAGADGSLVCSVPFPPATGSDGTECFARNVACGTLECDGGYSYACPSGTLPPDSGTCIHDHIGAPAGYGALCCDTATCPRLELRDSACTTNYPGHGIARNCAALANGGAPPPPPGCVADTAGSSLSFVGAAAFCCDH